MLLTVNLLIWNLMMIRDKHRHPLLLCTRNLFDRCDSVVAGHNRINTCLDRILDQMKVQTVTIRNPVRNRNINVCLTPRERPVQYIGRHHAINIIITNDPDFLFLLHFPDQNLHKLHRILHPVCIRQIC